MTDRHSDVTLEYDTARANLRELRREIDRTDFGEDDDYPDETVLMFRYRFNGFNDGSEYTYVALKKERRWWVTGRTKRSYSWDQLVEFWLEGKVSEMWVVAEWEEFDSWRG